MLQLLRDKQMYTFIIFFAVIDIIVISITVNIFKHMYLLINADV